MRLTVLGKSPSWQDADGACSGYLLEEEGTTVLLDCGNGVLSKLRRFRDYTNVDAVVISHLHADHFLDLVPFSYALTYAPRQQPTPVDRWPGTDPRPPEAVRAARRDRMLSPGGRRLGQRRPDRERVRPVRVLSRRRARDRLDALHVPGRAALHGDVRDRHRVHERRRPDHLRRRLLPERAARRLRARHGPADRRGDAAPARAHRHPRSPRPPPRPRITPAART